jgi:hypothetical protein
MTASGIIVAAMATGAPASAESGDSNGQTYAVAVKVFDGSDPGRWHAEIGQLSGGDAAVVEAFNSASLASAQDHIDRFRADALPQWTLDLTGRVTFANIAIAQVISGFTVMGAGHPPQDASTVVIDSRTARPITLASLFSDEQAGLDRLSQQTKILMPEVTGIGGVMPDFAGNAPLETNFADWIPTADGMRIFFGESQFDYGPRGNAITVPWAALSDVLAPDMRALTET